jgi:hypothetical protein
MAVLGEFTLVIDGERLGSTPETKALVTIRTQHSSGVLADPDADKFWTPHASADDGSWVTLPYETTLATDVASGAAAGTESETIGYDIVVQFQNGAGAIHAVIAAQRAGTTHNLVDLVDVVVEPLSSTQQYRNEAEAFRDEAQAAAAQAAAAGLDDAELAALIPGPSATGTALSAAYARRHPALPGDPVAQLGGGLWKPTGQIGAGVTGVTWVNKHKMAVATTDIRLVWTQGVQHNAATVNDGETPFTQRVPVKASVQVGTTLHRVTFNGQRQGYLDPGAGALVSDPLALDLAAGDTFKTRTYTALAAGEWFGQSMASVGPDYVMADGGFTMGSDLTDVTTAQTSNGPANWFGPSLVIGTPASTPGKSVYAVGDSIDAGGGSGGDDSAYYTAGWLTRVFNNGTVPLYRATYPGQAVNGFRLNHAAEFPLASNFTHLASGFGSNDIAYGRTYAQIVADLTWFYTQARARGLKVCQRTILPRTNAANTIPVAGFEAGGASIRGQLNAWIRAGGAGLIDLVIETADTVESARDSGLWKASMQTDGLHPNTAASTLMAAALTPAALP